MPQYSASHAHAARTVENDVDDLDMVRLGENIEAWSVQALEKAQAGDVAGARNVLLEGCVTDPRCRAHGRWWLARAHLEGKVPV